jgi:hypothetical protein
MELSGDVVERNVPQHSHDGQPLMLAPYPVLETV